MTPVAAGQASVTVSATDMGGTNTAHGRDLAVTVGANGSPAPVGSLADVQVMVGKSAVPADVASAFQDPDGDALTYGATSSKPAVAAVALAGSTLSVEPVGLGAARISVTATDAAGSGTTAIQQFAVEVLPNRPPVAVGSLPDISMNQNPAGRTVDVSAAFEDPEDDALTYGAASLEVRRGDGDRDERQREARSEGYGHGDGDGNGDGRGGFGHHGEPPVHGRGLERPASGRGRLASRRFDEPEPGGADGGRVRGLRGPGRAAC